MLRKTTLAIAACLSIAGGAAAQDAIVGDWKTEAGSTAGISACGSSFCIKLKTGGHAGKSIGRLKADGGSRYSGQITDPANDKTYSGKATLAGKTLKLSGCVLGGLICRSQNWSKQ